MEDEDVVIAGLSLILLFGPVLYSSCLSAPPSSIFLLFSILLFQCSALFSEIEYQLFPLRPLSDGEFIFPKKNILCLIKLKYSDKSCCMLLKSVCWCKR